jgi:hypothetical protein
MASFKSDRVHFYWNIRLLPATQQTAMPGQKSIYETFLDTILEITQYSTLHATLCMGQVWVHVQY